ncbi:MAG: c-type cytochrome [Deltaproteobacteria bacterium]|nr:c-type cytochrome [Deltaproteobacteria bacterium]
MKKILGTMSLAALALAVMSCEPERRPVEPGQSPVSGPIALTADDANIVIAAEDQDLVLIVDRATREVRHSVSVGDAPSHLVVHGDVAVVTTRYGHSVAVIDIAKGTVVKTIAVGTEPMGLVMLPGGNRAAVVLAGDAAVAVVDLTAGVVEQTIALNSPDPRAVALLADGSLYVSHLSSGNFSRVDVVAGTARLVSVKTRNDFGAQLNPEHLRSLTVDPVSGNVLVAHSQANADTVRAPIGDPSQDNSGQENCGYNGCANSPQLGAVVPGVTEVDPNENVVIVPQSVAQNQNGGGARDDCFDCAIDPGFGGFGVIAAPPSVLNPFDGRFNGVQLSNPTTMALFDGARGQLVVNMGSKNAILMRRQLDGAAADVLGVVKLGNGAQGVALAHDGAHAYVWNQFDGTVSELELPDVDGDQKDTKFVPDAEGKPALAELGVVPEFAADTFLVVADALEVDASIGRKMFHDATDSRIAASGTVSCASCHPDGRSDGQTWQFTFGPRNTPQLGGGILDSAPFHWPGDVAAVKDLNSMTVLPFMGGSGLDDGSFQFVAAFIDTIRAAPSAASARAALNAAEVHGQEIFESAETGCTACHNGRHLTDNASYDIGSKADERDIRAFQTPVLHGLNRSAPFFHDGRFKDMNDLVERAVRSDKMGTGSHLTDSDAADLVAYLKTL